MTDHSRFALIRRPRLLLSAARFGLSEYNRSATLPRLLGQSAALTPGCYLDTLLDLEEAQNAERLARSASYSIGRHVDILIALLAEPGATADAVLS